MQSPTVKNTTLGALEEYNDVPEMAPLDFTADGITLVASKLSGAVGALGSEATKLRNYITTKY